jgi:uncharacterized membrane protein YfcA
MSKIIITGIIGLLIGIIAGFTGIISAGVIIILLHFSNIIPDYKTNIGTLLYYALFPITIGGLYEYYTNKKVNFLIGNILVVSTIIGGLIGSKLVFGFKLTDKTLNYISSAISFIMFIFFAIMGNHSK